MRAISLLLLAAMGCSEDGALDARGSASSGAPAGTSCTLQNLTQACTCPSSWAGKQTCSAGAWSTCTCRTPAAGSAGSGPGGLNGAVGTLSSNSSSARFDWQRTESSTGSCEAGHYEGTFGGIYGPSIIVVADLKVVPVFPIDLPGSPGLQFDLMRQGQGEVFTVSNGKMNGNALGAFPFTADIMGELDCDQLKFDARLVNGSYFIGPLEYKFEGPLIANYDKQSHSFIVGTWNVMEPAWPGAGGGGDWSASWKHN